MASSKKRAGSRDRNAARVSPQDRIATRVADQSAALETKGPDRKSRRLGEIPKTPDALTTATANARAATRDIGPLLKATIKKIVKHEVPKSALLLPIETQVEPGVGKASIGIWDTGPDEWIENRQAWVEFSVQNFQFGDTPVPTSFVKATITPKHSLQSYDGNFEFPIAQLNVFDSVQGAFSFLLPRADQGNTLTLTWYRFGPYASGWAGTTGTTPAARLSVQAAAGVVPNIRCS